MDNKKRRKALAQYYVTLKKQRLLLLLLLEESKQRKGESPLFKKRSNEGVYVTLIKRHLDEDEKKFQEYFRLTKAEFQYVLELIEEDLKVNPTNRVRRPIQPREKFAVTLRFLAAGESYHSLQFYYRISASYISVFVPQVLDAIIKHVVPIQLPPPSEINWEEKSEEFMTKWNFPNLIAAIDGKHVRIVNPDDCGSLYFNYKNFFSIVLLAMVGANYEFLIVDIGSYGKEGDAGIFAKSKTGKEIYSGTFNFPAHKPFPTCTEPVPHVICGDEAFRLHRRVMKPFPKEQSRKDVRKTIFNYRLSRARRVTENAFGILAVVFRIFFLPIKLKAETVDKVILSCCALHNLMRTRPIGPEDEEAPCETPTLNMIPLNAAGGFQGVDGFQVREIFTEYFNGIGSVPWQNEYAYK